MLLSPWLCDLRRWGWQITHNGDHRVIGHNGTQWLSGCMLESESSGAGFDSRCDAELVVQFEQDSLNHHI